LENSVTVTQFEQWFTQAEDATRVPRQEAERARDYLDGAQLTPEEEAELKRRGQPPIVFNHIRRKVEWLKGLEVKQRTDPKAFPRTPQHQDDAESVTDAIRYVCDDQDWDTVRSECYDNFLVEGFGGCEVVHKPKRGTNLKASTSMTPPSVEYDVVINHYPWDRLFYDPHSRKPDFSDARYKGVVLWMDLADFKRDHPDQAENVDTRMSETARDTYDDKPANIWFDANRNRVRVILIWYREGDDWKWCKFIQGAKLEGGESPYVDEDGDSVCPLIMGSAYVSRELTRYGVVRDMFSPQDEVNKRRSKSLHNLSSRQTVGVQGAVGSVAALKRELSKSDGHIEVTREAYEDASRAGAKPFDILPNGDQTSGQLALMESAERHLDIIGANSALAGDTGESASGRAVLARQQGGMIELAALTDRLHRFTREVYRHIWMRIRQFWTSERWVRVTDDEANVRFVGLNQPITLEQALGEMDQERAMGAAVEMGLYPGDPRLQQVVGIRNNLAELDVDIILEEVPDRVTLEGEVFEALLKYGPQIPPAVLIEADPTLPRKKKDKLLKMLQQPPAPSPVEQLEMASKEAEISETQAKATKLQAEAAAQMPLAGLA
jgi:hypothetical protein